MADTTVAAPLPRLYVYDACPFGVRARAIFGLKHVDHVLEFVAMHDVETPVGLVGVKKTPILKPPTGDAFAESGDIIKWVDENYGDTVILQPASGRQDLADWTTASMFTFLKLILPRVEGSPLPEFATKRSRDYYRNGKEPMFGKFDELLAKSPEFIVEANKSLAKLKDLLFSDRLVNESGLSYDDIEVFATLRGITIVKGLEWPPKVRAFVEYYAKVGDIPLLDAMAQ